MLFFCCIDVFLHSVKNWIVTTYASFLINKIAKPKLNLIYKKIFRDTNNIDLLINFLLS